MNHKNLFNKPSQIAGELSSLEVQKLLMQKAKNAVLSAAIALMEQDMQKLCGNPFERKTEELCHRGGSELTSLMLDGAQHSLIRPRARKNGKEVVLPSLEKMRDRDLLDSQMFERIVNGVSTRNYQNVIGSLADKTGISKSSVSRAFKRASKKDLDAINSCDLSGYKFVAIFIDGTGVGGSTQIVAVGITDDNQKIPLGLVEGTTENARVVTDLLTSIMARGFTLKASRILAVLDGGKALRSAVLALWGESVLIQRCWIHKLRNIKDYIPKSSHGQLWWRMKKMMTLNNLAAAEKEFRDLSSWLAAISFDAEKSLQEAGTELLTVHRLGLTGEYRNSLSNTNIAESLVSVAKTKIKNVKNWNYHPKTNSKIPRDKSLRWTAMAINAHKSKMRRLRGGKEQLDSLLNKLNSIDLNQKAA